MSAYNRYYFTKDVYPRYLVILLKKGKPYSFGIDRKILNYIRFKDKTYILQKKRINYLILDELDIVEILKQKLIKMSKIRNDNFYQFLFYYL